MPWAPPLPGGATLGPGTARHGPRFPPGESRPLTQAREVDIPKKHPRAPAWKEPGAGAAGEIPPQGVSQPESEPTPCPGQERCPLPPTLPSLPQPRAHRSPSPPCSIPSPRARPLPLHLKTSPARFGAVLGCRAQALHPGAVLSPPGTTEAPCPCGAARGTRVPARPGSLPSAGLGSRSQSRAVGISCLYLQSGTDPEAGRRMSQLPAQSRIPPRAGAAALLSVQTGTIWRGSN